VKCEHARAELTAYLDGELDADRGSAVRGHLRTCDACRQVATDEAAVRDELRSLPTLDPPSTMWSGIQARLAKAEVADAEKPRWRLVLARWLRPVATPRFALAGVALAAAVTVLAWRASHRGHGVESPIADVHTVPGSGTPVPVPAPAAPPPAAEDVTADLAGDVARVSTDYAHTAESLLVDAKAARESWTQERKHAFDLHVTELQQAIDHAQGRVQHKRYRELIRYLQRAAVYDDVALADVGGGR
jgi:predicted anti-sigma-YlaC factor YlaD